MSGSGGNQGGRERKQTGSGPQEAGKNGASGDLAGRLSNLGERLNRTRKEAEPEKAGSRPDNAGFAMALRLSTEFVSAILLGAGIGWMIDRFFGVSPWGMILFLMLGFCAGVLNVLRSAGRISEPAGRLEKDSSDGDGR